MKLILFLIVVFVFFASAQSDIFAPADGDYIEPIDNGNDDDGMNSGFPDQVFDPWAPAKGRPWGRRRPIRRPPLLWKNDYKSE